MRVDLADPEDSELTETVVKLLNGHNKSEIARTLDVSRETLYRWERGESVPSVTELQRLAHATGNEVNLRLNTKEPSLEQQVKDLRDALAVFQAGRTAVLDLIDKMPDVDHEEIERIRASMRRLPPL